MNRSLVFFLLFLHSMHHVKALIRKSEGNPIVHSKDYWFPGKERHADYVYKVPTPEFGCPPKDKPKKDRTIFVSIASYRDSVCPSTIDDMYKNAKYPERIFLGVYQQNDPEDADCIANLQQKTLRHVHNMRILRINYKDANGPCPARHYCSQLYNGEDYFLQIDSHTRFIEDWDVEHIDMWEDVAERRPEALRKVILSTYPIEYNVSHPGYPPNYDKYISVMCKSKDMQDMLVPAASLLSPIDNGPLYEQNYIAAGWLFGPGSILEDVPFDDELPWLFRGEEVLHSIRLWVAGYRIYNPTKSILAHYYTRANNPKIWDLPSYAAENVVSTDKVRRCMLMTDLPGPYPRYCPTKEEVLSYYTRWRINIRDRTMPDIC
eukprot:TRINITY_DN7079_c0_g1_i1.p1 TRINITY_DN7079_c0_g1~~TRINITY_DN7079_c0_g1_i1.p1  ORF type:complete len:376 (-),score=45.07 TRINITY_DN7079_c0_g1_i1:96-1223(-)